MRDTKEEILFFWFEETNPSLWYQNNPEFDENVRERFSLIYDMAKDGLCDDWNRDAEGCLALCIMLNQFPRFIYRGKPEAYATDNRALLVAKHAVLKGFDQVLSTEKRRYIYLPYQHSEKRADQDKSVELFEKIKDDDPLSYEQAVKYHQIINDFDRFPVRNAILGRDNLPEEEEYLAQQA